MGFTVTANMFGADVDLTPYVTEATWKHGSRPPNYFGHLADPSVGSLTLLNQGGEFKTFAPAVGIDTTPGPPVTIDYDGIRLFWGRAGLTLNQVLPDGRDIAVMPLLGPLAFLSRFSEGIFARLDGIQRTDEVFSRILADAGHTGPTSIQVGRTMLSAVRVNRSSLLGSGRQRTAVLSALRTVVQAEVGRAYDDRFGRVVFENRTHRSSFWANATALLLDHSNTLIERASIGNVDDSIVNIVSGTGDAYNSLGLQDIGFTQSLPMTVTVQPGGRIILLDVDTSGNVEFIQSWEPLERGGDFTYTLGDVDPFLEFGAATLGVHIPNPSPVNQTFTLTKVRGEPFGLSIKERIDVRREASIGFYGPRPVIYPADLITDVAEIRDHLEWAATVHDGVNSAGQKDLNEVRAVTATVNLLDPANAGVIGVDIGALALVTEPRLGLASAPFWVDAAEYSVAALPEVFRVTMALTDARASMMWPLDGATLGFNSRVGF